MAPIDANTITEYLKTYGTQELGTVSHAFNVTQAQLLRPFTETIHGTSFSRDWPGLCNISGLSMNIGRQAIGPNSNGHSLIYFCTLDSSDSNSDSDSDSDSESDSDSDSNSAVKYKQVIDYVAKYPGCLVGDIAAAFGCSDEEIIERTGTYPGIFFIPEITYRFPNNRLYSHYLLQKHQLADSYRFQVKFYLVKNCGPWTNMPTCKQVIDYVTEHPGCKVRDIANALGCTQQAITTPQPNRISTYPGIYSMPEIITHRAEGFGDPYEHYPAAAKQACTDSDKLPVCMVGLWPSPQLTGRLRRYQQDSSDSDSELDSCDYGYLDSSQDSESPSESDSEFGAHPDAVVSWWIWPCIWLITVYALTNPLVAEKLNPQIEHHHHATNQVIEDFFNYLCTVLDPTSEEYWWRQVQCYFPRHL